MNRVTLSISKIKLNTVLSLIFLLFGIFFSSCKKENQENPDPMAADSSSISSLIVSCKSSNASATGFAVIDIQQLFLAKKLISSTIKGKILIVGIVYEADFKSIVDRIVLDLQVPETYFKNYDSFLSILEERFKTKIGYQKSYEINQSQIEQLFDRQGVLLAINKNSFRDFLRNISFASVGLGNLKIAPLSETFTLNNFQGLVTVGTKITGSVSNYQTLKGFFGTEASRSTSLTKDDQVIFKSFIGAAGGGSYSYHYPLPPSPAPIFDAPVWYWHQYTTGTAGGGIDVIPLDASTTTWATAEDRYQAIRLKAQQVSGVTINARTYFEDPGLTDAETAYIVYSATFYQRYKNSDLTLWVAFNDKKRELYQFGFYNSTGYLSLLKFVNASVVNGNYSGDPSWVMGWYR